MYTEENVMNALQAVKKRMAMRAASQQYKVPFCTITAKHQVIYPIGKKEWHCNNFNQGRGEYVS